MKVEAGHRALPSAGRATLARPHSGAQRPEWPGPWAQKYVLVAACACSWCRTLSQPGRSSHIILIVCAASVPSLALLQSAESCPLEKMGFSCTAKSCFAGYACPILDTAHSHLIQQGRTITRSRSCPWGSVSCPLCMALHGQELWQHPMRCKQRVMGRRNGQ